MEQNDLIDLRRYVSRTPDVALQKLAVAFRGSLQAVEKSIDELKQIKTVLTIAEFDTLLTNIETELTFGHIDDREENKIKLEKVKATFKK